MALTAGLGLAQSQGGIAKTTSLGELARGLKAERATASKKPAKVFTNDSLPARPPRETLSVAAGMQEEPKEQPETKTEAGPTSAAGALEGHGEKYYRQAVSDLRERLERHQRQLAILEQKLAQGQMVFYGDPQKTLMEESTPAFYSDANKLRQEIEKKREEIAADEKAMDDLRDQLRREGGNPGWLR